MNDKNFSDGPIIVDPTPILPSKTQRIREMLTRAREQQHQIASLLNNLYSTDSRTSEEGSIKCSGKPSPGLSSIVSRLDDIESELESILEFGDTNITKLSQLV